MQHDLHQLLQSRPALQRRLLLQWLAAAGASSALPTALAQALGSQRPPTSPISALLGLADTPFALGVASGEPTADGVVLWTRLMPRSAAPLPATPVRWQVAHDANFRRLVHSGNALAMPEWGHSVHIEVQGLEPERWYYYRFLSGCAISPTGRTRTAPAPATMARQLRLAYASCQRWEHGEYSAWLHLCADEPDLVLFLGDYIYEYAAPPNTLTARPAGSTQRINHSIQPLRAARTLSDYRDRYALHKSDPLLQAAHAQCPWVVTWDDHEVVNDYAGSHGAGDPATFLLQRAAAWQAFYENMPLRASVLAPSGFAQMQIYRRFAWGQLANFHVLDARQYKDWQACRPAIDNADARNTSAPAIQPDQCPQWSDPERTFLGQAQESWLQTGLAQDAARHSAHLDGGPRWSVLAQQTLFTPRHYPSGVRSTDNWDGYPAARTRLLETLTTTAPRNTVLLGGDIHQNYVCQVRADSEREDSPIIASEFCGTSITSRSGTTQKKVDAVARANPHVLLANCEYRGYGLVDITPTRWTTQLRTLTDANDTQSAIFTLARFVVQDQLPGPVRD